MKKKTSQRKRTIVCSNRQGYMNQVLAQGERQKKIPISKKFWKKFPLGALVKIELIDDSSLFYVSRIQRQGKLQRRIPLPLKFWASFPVSSLVKVELMRKKKR